MTHTAERERGITTHRSAEEIGRTERGPRPLPELGAARTLPEPDHLDTVLDSGLRVLAVRRGGVPMVELRLVVPFGGTDPGHAARVELLAASLLHGTERRGRYDIDTELAGVGGDLGVRVDPEHLSAHGSALVTGLPAMLDVLADVLCNATYPAGEVVRERARLVERITVSRSQPRTIAREALQQRRYGDHPVTREMPTAEAMAAVDPATLRATHDRALVPRGAALVLVGDIEPAAAIDAVRAAFADWHADHAAEPMIAVPDLTPGPLLFIDRPGAVQSQIRLSAQAVDRTDPRYGALKLANLVFGGYFSSRWVENIREDKGYTYSAHSGFEYTGSGATLLADADTASAVTAGALLETQYELGRMAIAGPTDEEIESARQYAIGTLTIGTSSQGGLAGNLSALLALGLDLTWLREHSAALRAVDADEVRAVAAEFLAPTRFAGVVVGDAQTSAAALAALGGVDLP